MGNCIRHESPMQWGGDDWEDGLSSSPESGADPAVAADLEETEDLLEKSRQRWSGNAAATPAVAAARVEVKIRITKRQLEELLGKPDTKEEKTVERLVSQLMAISASDRFETGQRSWRPALKSIPEVN
ncbi:uncharacterized protein LOC104452113 [Eucalyptus grandis]|uniref:Uncharacterized protein n=2 Tax=Eucalyptus grandis TaxID=71139 RepID=A0ACC3KLP7_EUCGR|nr:uncharacterized protein LOC104452113 [Eucalyptus grandis]KAK3427179.1 hypothetical protein EUGRSUZ_F03465 [Eucalyptus grandis]